MDKNSVKSLRGLTKNIYSDLELELEALTEIKNIIRESFKHRKNSA